MILKKTHWILITLLSSTLLSACSTTQVHHTGCYVADSALWGRYTGPCKNKKADGKGVAVGRDRYEGSFVQGVMHGKGTNYWSDGDRYTGEFRNGKAHGKGAFISRSGEKKSGTWVENVLQTSR
jgi:hypothetical protein